MEEFVANAALLSGHLTRQESRALFGAGKPETKG